MNTTDHKRIQEVRNQMRLKAASLTKCHNRSLLHYYKLVVHKPLIMHTKCYEVEIEINQRVNKPKEVDVSSLGI
jgi:hypothetical protein